MNPSAVQDELNFWKSFVKTVRFKQNWATPSVQNPELDIEIARFIIAHNRVKDIKVLDLGCGVVSILNGYLKSFQLVSCDPLANYYSEIFDYEANGIVKPLPYRTEDLPYKEEFDMVHMRNALDHSQEPEEAYHKMFQACKQGGYVIISGFENEGTEEGWSGFHQWDIYIENKMLMLRNDKGESFQIANRPDAIIERRQLENGKWWFNWICKKL